MDRRTLLKGTLLGAVALIRPRLSLAANQASFENQLASLEHQHGGRLGVAIQDIEGGRRVSYRADERFLMCSTFKLIAVSAVLARIDGGAESLDRRITFGEEAVLSYAPITSHRVGGQGMTVAELCQAAITVSDNTAANLLLNSLGGPAAVTAFARRMGDRVTRLDRIEPELNVSSPGDLRDTTSPDAMVDNLRSILQGDVLSDASRAQMAAWLCASSTGKDTVRAGVPTDWRVGDKTGRGGHGETNDVAAIWPPQRKPLLVAAYYVNPDTDGAGQNRVLAEVGRIAAATIAV